MSSAASVYSPSLAAETGTAEFDVCMAASEPVTHIGSRPSAALDIEHQSPRHLALNRMVTDPERFRSERG